MSVIALANHLKMVPQSVYNWTRNKSNLSDASVKAVRNLLAYNTDPAPEPAIWATEKAKKNKTSIFKMVNGVQIRKTKTGKFASKNRKRAGIDIRKERIKNGITLTSLAKATKTHLTYLSSMENGHQPVSKNRALMLAKQITKLAAKNKNTKKSG